MKCQAAYVWLLASKETATLPDEVQRHLGHCRRCQRCQRRLQRLDAELKRPPAALADPGVKARLFRTLAQPPRQIVPASPPPAPRGRWRRRFLVCATAAAVLLSLALGWFLGRGRDASPPETPLVSTSPPTETVPALDLVVRAVRHDLSLAETVSPIAQARALGALAADLRGEALRLARQGPLENLPLVAKLYENVLHRGLLGRARAVPADRRPAELAPLAKQLRDSEVEMSRAAEESLPAVGDYLRAMGAAAGETSQLLLAPPEAAPPAKPAATGSEPRSLLETVVGEGLRLAEENDPLRRADSCSAVAEQLVQTILLASAMGEVKRASALGQCLGEMAERGVAANLNRVEVDDKDVAAELERVRRRAAAASAALQSNWQRAPAPARKGLERAMEVSRGGLERAAHAGKGKGKPKPKDKHDHPPKGRPVEPPGLEKKKPDKNGAEQRKEKRKHEPDGEAHPSSRSHGRGKPPEERTGSR